MAALLDSLNRKFSVGAYVSAVGFNGDLICKIEEITPHSIKVRVVEYKGEMRKQRGGMYEVGDIRWFSPVSILNMPNYKYLAEARDWEILAASCTIKGKLHDMCVNMATNARLKLSRCIGGAYRIA